MKQKCLYFVKIILIWAVVVFAFFWLCEKGIEAYEYAQKQALPKHVLRQFYFYQGLTAVFGFGSFLLWLFYREERRCYKKRLNIQRINVLEKFSSYVAHEIRNPLTSLSLNAELIQQNIAKREGPQEEELKKLAEDFINGILRLSGQTEHYLAFRDKGREKEIFSAGSAFKKLIGKLNAKADEKGVCFSVAWKPKDEVKLSGDANRFGMAMEQLLNNSIEAMPQGGTIFIEGIQKRRYVILKIKDSGVGMPREVLERLFEPFFTTKLKGAGLGLPLAGQILEEFSASVACRSVVGKGTTFQMKFPLVKSSLKKKEVA